MANKQPLQDKRACPRYLVSDSSAVILTPGNIVSYCLLDVSKSGLAFCYNGQSNENNVLKDAIATFFTENIGSSDISVKIVSDTELPEADCRSQKEPYISKKPYLRRCGIKFNELSQDQENMLNGYIQSLSMNSSTGLN